MKITVKREALLKALQKISNIIGSRTTLPILANVIFEAENNTLTLTTTDLELRLTTSIEASVETAGKTTLPAKRLLGLVAKFKGDTICFSSNENNHTEINCDTANFMLLGLSADDFPLPVEFTSQRQIKLKQAELSRIIDRISYSVSQDDSRKVLQGLFFSVKEGNLTAVATDGKRLALVEKLLEEAPTGSDGDIIITFKAAAELRRILEKEGDVIIQIGDRQAIFKIGNTTMVSKLIEGNYPNYKQVIPPSFTKKVQIPSANFIDALEIVSVPLADSSSSYVKLTFGDNKLLFESNSNVGEGKETIKIEYADESLSVSFNPQFLSDPFKHIGVDNVTMKINDTYSPIAIESGDGFLYVIMPVRK